MKRPSLPSLTLATIATAVAISLSACGSSQSTDKPAAASAAPAPAAASAPAPAATIAEVPAKPVEAPPPAPAVSTPKPAAKHNPEPKPVTETASTAPSEPPPAPKAAPVEKTVPAGTQLEVELLDNASSKTSHVGDPFRARVTKDVVIDGNAVVRQGSIATGVVTEAIPLKAIGGAASLGLKFQTLELTDGAKSALVASLLEKGKSETGKDAGTIAGAAAGGALLGRILSKHDKTKGTLIGAAVGAAAGTGIAASTKGQEIELPPGTPLVLHIEAPLTVMVQPVGS